MGKMDSYKIVKRILFYTLFLNILVAGAKLSYGYMIRSISMMADGYHSFFDGTSNIIGLVGIWLASHPPDKNHPYGHRKYETLASLGISILLFIACYRVLRDAYFRFKHVESPEVNIYSILIMLITIMINGFVMLWEKRKGEELGSQILIADSLHTKSDLFASLSVLASLGAVRIGLPLIDPIAAFIIAILIGRTGYEILLEAGKVLSDYSRISPSLIKEAALSIEGIKECHEIRTRGTANHVYVDLRVHVPPGTNIEEAHRLAHRVEEEIKRRFPEVTEVVVHIEPEKKGRIEEKTKEEVIR